MSTTVDVEKLRHDKKTRCPNCFTAFTGTLSPDGENRYKLQLTALDRDESWKLTMLYQSLRSYFRWVAEGKKPHGTFTDKEHPFGIHGVGQHYHDDYHNHVEYLPEEGAYRFHIQTSDSDMGDTWWGGKFKLWGAGEIKEIYDEETTNS